MADSGSLIGNIGEELGNVVKQTVKSIAQETIKAPKIAAQQAAIIEEKSEEIKQKDEADKVQRLARVRSNLQELNKPVSSSTLPEFMQQNQEEQGPVIPKTKQLEQASLPGKTGYSLPPVRKGTKEMTKMSG